jgi:hypothetical protein
MALELAKEDFKQNFIFVPIDKISRAHKRQLQRRKHVTVPAIFKKASEDASRSCFVGGYEDMLKQFY